MTKPGTTSATSAILPVGPLIFCPWPHGVLIPITRNWSRLFQVPQKPPAAYLGPMPIILVQIVVVLSLAQGLNSFVLPANLLRSNWRPSTPLEGSCNLALFQRSWQRQQIQGRFKHGKPGFIQWGRSWSSSLFKQFANAVVPYQKKQEKTHRRNTDLGPKFILWDRTIRRFSSGLPFWSTKFVQICQGAC